MNKTTSYPEKSIDQQMEEMNSRPDKNFKREIRNFYCSVLLGVLIGIAMCWVGLCCYFYFGHH